MRLIVGKDYEEMSRFAADVLAAQVILKPDSVLGLATGSSPIGTYRELVKRYEAGTLDFSACRSVNLDEYVGLGREDDQSYVYFMHDNLFDHINMAEENIHLPNGKNPDAADECARYDALIRSMGGIDLQLLGLGPNGHIGFNEPDEFFAKGTQHIQLTQSTIDANKRFFQSEADVPRSAYTMGIRDIMQAKRVLMVVSGKGKAKILKEAFTGPITPKVPASILQLHPDFILVADADAASELQNTL